MTTVERCFFLRAGELRVWRPGPVADHTAFLFCLLKLFCPADVRAFWSSSFPHYILVHEGAETVQTVSTKLSCYNCLEVQSRPTQAPVEGAHLRRGYPRRSEAHERNSETSVRSSNAIYSVGYNAINYNSAFIYQTTFVSIDIVSLV